MVIEREIETLTSQSPFYSHRASRPTFQFQPGDFPWEAKSLHFLTRLMALAPNMDVYRHSFSLAQVRAAARGVK